MNRSTTTEDLGKHVSASRYLGFQQGYEKPSTVMFRVSAANAGEAETNVKTALTTLLGAALPVSNIKRTAREDTPRDNTFDVTVKTSNPTDIIHRVRDGKNLGWRDK